MMWMLVGCERWSSRSVAATRNTTNASSCSGMASSTFASGTKSMKSMLHLRFCARWSMAEESHHNWLMVQSLTSQQTVP
jgi:hypothetical protein